MNEPIDEKKVYDLLAELNARLDAAIAKNIQQKAARKAERAELGRRRTYAKTRMHDEKLRRNAGDTTKENQQ